MLTPTQEKIHQVAMEHFLRYGFRQASLRKIVAESGFTSGAFYGYYDKKEDLFDALVKETADGILSHIMKIGDQVEELPSEHSFTGMSEMFSSALPDLLDFLFHHLEETRLLFKCADGTRYENFLSDVMTREWDYWRKLTENHLPLSTLAANLLLGSYFRLLSDAVLSGASREEITRAMEDINNIYVLGMMNLIKEQKENEAL